MAYSMAAALLGKARPSLQMLIRYRFPAGRSDARARPEPDTGGTQTT